MATMVATKDRIDGLGQTRRIAVLAVLLGCVVAAMLAGIGSMRGPAPVGHPPVRRATVASPPPVTTTPPPPVVPTVLADLTPDQARIANAAMPYAAGKPPVPAHFVYTGSVPDRDAALTCLAAAALYEAGDDRIGEQAVAQVVLNRLRHPAFPKTVCGVVLQGSERPTGCQFTFTCDGSLDRPPRPEAWTRAKAIADSALSGHVDPDVGTATHYHTDWVVPYWRDSLVKLAKVHTQIFYRWPGGWGQPGAFVGRAQPFERLDPRLVPLAGPEQAAISRAVSGQGGLLAPLPEADVADKPLPPEVHIDGVTRAGLHGSVLRLADTAANQYVLQLDSTTFPGSWAMASLELCGGAADCMVFGWLHPRQMPRQLPFVPNGIQGMSFLFRRSSALGKEQALWNCQQVRRDDAAQCLPGTR